MAGSRGSGAACTGVSRQGCCTRSAAEKWLCLSFFMSAGEDLTAPCPCIHQGVAFHTNLNADHGGFRETWHMLKPPPWRHGWLPRVPWLAQARGTVIDRQLCAASNMILIGPDQKPIPLKREPLRFVGSEVGLPAAGFSLQLLDGDAEVLLENVSAAGGQQAGRSSPRMPLMRLLVLL